MFFFVFLRLPVSVAVLQKKSPVFYTSRSRHITMRGRDDETWDLVCPPFLRSCAYTHIPNATFLPTAQHPPHTHIQHPHPPAPEGGASRPPPEPEALAPGTAVFKPRVVRFALPRVFCHARGLPPGAMLKVRTEPGGAEGYGNGGGGDEGGAMDGANGRGRGVEGPVLGRVGADQCVIALATSGDWLQVGLAGAGGLGLWWYVRCFDALRVVSRDHADPWKIGRRKMYANVQAMLMMPPKAVRCSCVLRIDNPHRDAKKAPRMVSRRRCRQPKHPELALPCPTQNRKTGHYDTL